MSYIHKKTNPYLFDKAVEGIQYSLENKLFWLRHIFGICEVLTDVKNGVKFTSANYYLDNDEYMQVMPCEELGNFSFFVLRDPQEVSDNGRVVSSPFSLIIWYNVDEVSSSPDSRNREAIKASALIALRDARIKGGALEVTRVYERPQNIFSDFSYDHTNNQCLMSPYAGLRIDGVLTIKLPCSI